MSVDILQKEQTFALPLLLEASAGTGKTFFISHFVIRSLLEGIPLEQIAAITFTKKAAAELKERIFSLIDEVFNALKEKSARFGYLEPYLEDEAKYHEAIKRLNAAKVSNPKAIGTIHHFANLLLTEFSPKALTISSDLVEHFAKLVRELLEKTPSSPFLKALLLLSLKQEKGWQKWINALYEWPYDEKAPKALQYLEQEAYKILEKGRDLIPLLQKEGVLELWIECFKGAKALLAKANAFAKDLLKVLEGEAFLPDLLDLYPELLELEEKKKRIANLPEARLADFLENKLLPYFAHITTRAFLLDLFKEKVAFHWEEYRREKELVGFDDLLHEVEDLLQYPAIKEQIVSSYPLLIVDEFQDTDPLQWSIFSKLFLEENSTGNLLLVGDPKQSIYGFRKADLHTYLEAAMHPKLSKKTLSCNFRSAPILLESLNQLLASTVSQSWSWIPKKGLIEVPYLHAKSTKSIPLGMGAAIEIAIGHRQATRERNFPGSTWETSVCFPYIIEEIKKLSSCNIPLQEICILIEDRYQGFRLKDALDKANIPSIVDRSQDVRDHSELFALAKLLFQAIASPEKKSSLLSLLFSPLYQVDPKNNVDSIALEAEKELFYLQELFEKEKGRFFAMLLKKPLFAKGKSLEDGISRLDDLLYEGATRGFWVLIEKLITAEEGKLSSYPKLLDSWQKSFSSQEAWSIPTKENCNAVKMMTCFAAKGLEFDVVFALNLAGREELPLHPEKGEEAIAEKMRQLYVAVTRPKLKLYLLFPFEDPLQLHRFTPSPLELFFSQMLEGMIDLKTAIEKASFLKLEKIRQIVEIAENASLQITHIDPLSFSNSPFQTEESKSALHSDELCSCLPLNLAIKMEDLKPLDDLSFTGLKAFASKPYEEKKLEIAPSKDSFPSGKEIGDLIHRLLDELFCKELFTRAKKTQRHHFVKEFVRLTSLHEHSDALLSKIDKWLTMQLFDGKSLSDLDKSQLQSEMDFVVQIPKDSLYPKTVRGSIDLCVEVENKVWIIDWKTHLLPEEISYEELFEIFHTEGYLLQAKIYALAVQEWLALFSKSFTLEKALFCFIHASEPIYIEIDALDTNAIKEEILTLDLLKSEYSHE